MGYKYILKIDLMDVSVGQVSFLPNPFPVSLGVTPNIFFTYRVKNDRLENSILSAISEMFIFQKIIY